MSGLAFAPIRRCGLPPWWRPVLRWSGRCACGLRRVCARDSVAGVTYLRRGTR